MIETYLISIIRKTTIGVNYKKLMNGQLSLDNFNMLSVIGKGSYAKVALVKPKVGDTKVYAMKILKKKYIEKRKQ